MLHFFLTDYFLRERSLTQYEFYNYELAKWAEYYLGKKTAFHQSNWCAGRVTENPQDILLGGPTYDTPGAAVETGMGKLRRDWVKDNALHDNDNSHPNTYIISPWVPEFPQEWVPNLVHIESQLLAAQKIFAFCGQIWLDRTLAKMDNSIQARVKHKLIRCNIGVATQNLPFVKQKFNPIGKRQLLHISTLGSYKGFDITCKSLKGLDAQLNVGSKSLQAPIGLVDITLDGEKYGFNFLGEINNADPSFNQWVVDNCDFYIHTGTMDAQATAILENCARGLIPLVTPESGYASPHAIYLTFDPVENRKIIEQALNLPESELLERSHLVRQHIQEEHNWEKIFERIWDEITTDISNRSGEVAIPLINTAPAYSVKTKNVPFGDYISPGVLSYLGLREINWITFPDWSQLEGAIADLQKVVLAIFTSPDRDRITLLIDTYGIEPEAADEIVAEIVLDLLMQYDLDVSTEPQISLISDLSAQQWQDLIQRVQSRISLKHENKTAIANLGANKLPVKTLVDE